MRCGSTMDVKYNRYKCTSVPVSLVLTLETSDVGRGYNRRANGCISKWWLRGRCRPYESQRGGPSISYTILCQCYQSGLERSRSGDLRTRLRWEEMSVLSRSLHVLHDAIGLVNLGWVALQHLILESWNQSMCKDAKYHLWILDETTSHVALLKCLNVLLYGHLALSEV